MATTIGITTAVSSVSYIQMFKAVVSGKYGLKTDGVQKKSLHSSYIQMIHVICRICHLKHLKTAERDLKLWSLKSNRCSLLN